MNEFNNLDVPKEAHLGWYVISLDAINDYLHDDGQIHTGVCDAHFSSNGYFPTEYEAHKAAAEYYRKNGEVYPYGPLLQAAYKEVHTGSQVMNFLGA